MTGEICRFSPPTPLENDKLFHTGSVHRTAAFQVDREAGEIAVQMN